MWTKLDDTCDEHPKLLGIPASAGWAWVRSLLYCNRQLTDGLLPKRIATSLGSVRIRAILVERGLWIENPDGSYLVHDFLDWNPSRDKVLEERRKIRERVRRHRGNAVTEEGRNAVSNGGCNASPSRPMYSSASSDSESSKDSVPSETTSSPRRAARVTESYSADFLAFWDAYPRRVGKGAAWKVWKRERIALAPVLKALSWQVRSEAWTKDAGAFIPHPATYLNQRRWEDEPHAGNGTGPKAAPLFRREVRMKPLTEPKEIPDDRAD